VNELLERALAYAADLARRGAHSGVAIGKGPLYCATCDEPWPCRRLRKRYPRVGG
jgi:hypothetical protein